MENINDQDKEVMDITSDTSEEDSITTSTTSNTSIPLRRSEWISKPPKRYQDESFANIAIADEPQTFEEAINHPIYKDEWKEAIQAEYISLMDNRI